MYMDDVYSDQLSWAYWINEQIMFDFASEMESAGTFGILRGSRGKSRHDSWIGKLWYCVNTEDVAYIVHRFMWWKLTLYVVYWELHIFTVQGFEYWTSTEPTLCLSRNRAKLCVEQDDVCWGWNTIILEIISNKRPTFLPPSLISHHLRGQWSAKKLIGVAWMRLPEGGIILGHFGCCQCPHLSLSLSLPHIGTLNFVATLP